MRKLTSVVVAALVLAPAVASAEDESEQFTPEGYEFCGWKNLSDGSWAYDDPEPGAFLRTFARGMSCRAARRNTDRVRYTQLPPYRPLRLGYRCKTLDNDYEYSDVRCVKRGASRKFRFQTGS
jgi:hypothetical protein